MGRVVALSWTLLACTRATSAPPRDTASGTSALAASGEGGCAPSSLGLSAARAVAFFRAPPGCAGASGGGLTWQPLRTEDELRDAFRCADAGASGVDFARETVWLSSRSLSPAGAGFAVYDDGRRVHVVAKMRRPSPDEPRPMPMSFSLAITLPAGETREFVESTCTL